jgi:predicted enzyme related to lactoylglutathione lyase
MQGILTTPTNKLENSIEFYEKLGFKKVDAGGQHLYTDGKAIVEINPERHARAGIKLYKSSWASEVDAVSGLAVANKINNGYLLSDASGVWIYLVESEPTFKAETAEASFSGLGNFAGLSLETTDMKRSADIYKALGFTVVFGDDSQPYMSVALDEFTVTLMKPNICPHLFFNPSMTYFNGKEGNPKVIAKVRELGIPIAEEITHFNKEGIVDNIIIRDPGGYGFFLFND